MNEWPLRRSFFRQIEIPFSETYSDANAPSNSIGASRPVRCLGPDIIGTTYVIEQDYQSPTYRPSGGE